MVISRIKPGEEALQHLDSFKINTTYNTDGIGNWLRRARIVKEFWLLCKLNYSRSSVAFPLRLISRHICYSMTKASRDTVSSPD